MRECLEEQHVIELVHHELLSVPSEWSLYIAITSYMKQKEKEKDVEKEKKSLEVKLLSAVRLPYLTVAQLRQVTSDGHISSQVLTEALLHRLALREGRISDDLPLNSEGMHSSILFPSFSLRLLITFLMQVYPST